MIVTEIIRNRCEPSKQKLEVLDMKDLPQSRRFVYAWSIISAYQNRAAVVI